MMDDQLIVKNSEGKDEVINVIDIILDNETGKRYIFYTMNETDDIYASILVEKENNFIIEAISNDEEYALVEEILRNQIVIDGGSDE